MENSVQDSLPLYIESSEAVLATLTYPKQPHASYEVPIWYDIIFLESSSCHLTYATSTSSSTG